MTNLPLSLSHLADKQIILGSGSPRRAELLDSMGLPHIVKISDTDESVPKDIPIDRYATYLSELKYQALRNTLSDNDILITADTIVTIDGKVLNKPKNKTEAYGMLQTLSGKEHQVITGITCASSKGYLSKSDIASVYISDMDDNEISYYIDTFNPLDKAGSYGIQEWYGLTMIERISGSYYTIMGLPTQVLYHILKTKIQSIL